MRTGESIAQKLTPTLGLDLSIFDNLNHRATVLFSLQSLNCIFFISRLSASVLLQICILNRSMAKQTFPTYAPATIGLQSLYLVQQNIPHLSTYGLLVVFLQSFFWDRLVTLAYRFDNICICCSLVLMIRFFFL